MGDSFVAGYRVDQEATYSRLVEVALRAAGLRAEVLIAEIEQPATGLWRLLHGGFDWRPSLVVLGVTLGNDVAQTGFSVDPPGEFTLEADESGVAMSRREEPPAALRAAGVLAQAPCGGSTPGRRRRSSRSGGPSGSSISPSGRSRSRSPPRAARRLRTFSSTRRLNGLGVFLKAPPPAVEAAFGRLERVLVATAAAGRRNGTDLLVVLLPQRFQVQPEDWAATARAMGCGRPRSIWTDRADGSSRSARPAGSRVSTSRALSARPARARAEASTFRAATCTGTPEDTPRGRRRSFRWSEGAFSRKLPDPNSPSRPPGPSPTMRPGWPDACAALAAPPATFRRESEFP